jgi:RimJ/RimL family protein N-acetyltransferase
MPDLDPLPPFPVAGLGDGDVLVRLWRPDADAEGFLRLLRDPDQDRWAMPVFLPRPVDLAAARTRLEHDLTAARAGRPASYAVVAASEDSGPSGQSGQLLGDISLRLDVPPLRIADLGYGTLPEARGRGVATRALRLLSTWLLDPAGAGLPRVQLDHSVANSASCRVATGAGFAQEGVRRSYLPLLGDASAAEGWSRHDVCLHGRVAGDPPV